jgi:three-Cys-motif partner protein
MASRPAPDSELTVASDGLLARKVGAWAEEKLYYVDRYMSIFSRAMKDKWKRRVYIDLFSGPGRCVIQPDGREIAGSPLLALNAAYPFTDIYFNDADPSVGAALQQRVHTIHRRPTITFDSATANAAANRAAAAMSLDEPSTLGLAFIDPTAFQISFDAIRQLTAGRRIDLVITLMTGYLKRFIAEPEFETALDPFFGTRDWRSLVDLKLAGERITYRTLLDAYEERLKQLGYLHVNDDARMLNSKGSTIYHLVFASKHPRGEEFFRRISQKQFSGQQRLGL